MKHLHLLIIPLFVIALAPSALAQSRQLHATGRPVEDIRADVQDARGPRQTVATSANIGDILNQLRSKFTKDLNDDLNSALALAQQVPAGCSATPPTATNCSPADTTAVPCYQALLSLNGIVNSYTPPSDKPHLISDLEQLRIINRTIQSTNFKDACAPLVQDIQSQANQLISSVLAIVGGAAKIGVVIP